jgi:putative transcriptional regulator
MNGVRSGAVLMLCAVLSASAGTADAPEPVRFLVAARGLPDPHFSHTVVLLLQHDVGSAMGVIVNRPTRVTVAEVLPDVDVLSRYDGPVYFGGPVLLDRMLFMLRAADPPLDATRVAGDVYVSASRTALESMPLQAIDASRLRIFAGHAGWSPGQLDREIADGGWHLVPARMDEVFAADPHRVWERMVPDRQPLSARLAPPTVAGYQH